MKKANTFLSLSLTIFAGILLSACSDDDDPMPQTMADYEISVTNLTNTQSFAPIAVITHTSAYKPWALGEAASEGLEMLAEGGDGSTLLMEAGMDSHVTNSGSSTGITAPGSSGTVNISSRIDADLRISVAAMLVNTNDGFTGALSIPVGTMMPGDSSHLLAHVYDAGTEANSETAASLPGTSGEGFNAMRDDRNYIAIHAGVVTSDDGLSSSALDESHRWLGPAAKITITRTH
ncbi:MAG: spondin domain-containing protein [Gammaproteobacteria bacterium]|nr:spondin domain-containing protein [Gammaproteobacteria bacterium]MDH5800628.1 spondin domain-containing protein [Gammaproteobacteria bacterium]